MPENTVSIKLGGQELAFFATGKSLVRFQQGGGSFFRFALVNEEQLEGDDLQEAAVQSAIFLAVNQAADEPLTRLELFDSATGPELVQAAHSILDAIPRVKSVNLNFACSNVEASKAAVEQSLAKGCQS